MLIQPFPQLVELSPGYWICWPADRRRSLKIVRFREWLLKAAADDPSITTALALVGR
jgi:LysR family glycine cleavage system transcriptional activator